MGRNRILIFRNILLVFGISFQATWSIGLWLAKIPLASEKLIVSLDFLVYYSAGYIYRFMSAASVYNLILQQKIQETVANINIFSRFYPYNHPPILLPLLGWAVNGDYAESFYRWLIFLVIFFLASLGILIQILRLMEWDQNEIWIIGVSMFLFYPAMVSLIRGQDSSFLLLGLCLWTYGLITKKDIIAGLGLAMSVIRPQIALALAIPFIFKNRKVWWWFLLWGIVLLVYSWLLIGTEGLQDYINVLIFSGQGLGYDVEKMATLMGAILRMYPGIDPQLFHILGYSFYALSIGFLCLIWKKSTAISLKEAGLAILITTLFVPHLHGHDLVILIIPSIIAADSLSKSFILPQRYSALLILGTSLVLTLSDIITSPLLIYIIVLTLAILIWFPGSQIHKSLSQKYHFPGFKTNT
jgi:hypothetical protein